MCELVVVWLSLGSKTTWYGSQKQKKKKKSGKMKLLQKKLKNNSETYIYNLHYCSGVNLDFKLCFKLFLQKEI